MRGLILALATIGAMPALAADPPIPDTSQWTAAQWSAAARGDVDAAYQLYRDNHPGVFDTGNPGFNAQLRRARDSALGYAAKAHDAGGYADALGAFSVGLADHHAVLGARSRPSGPVTVNWPGFIPVWRAGKLFVHTAEPASGVSRGERIVSCDGLDPGALARRALATSPSYPLTPGEYWQVGGAPFNATPDAMPRRARVCRVQSTGGKLRTVTLDWRPSPDGFLQRRTEARTGRKSEIALTEPRPGVFWAGMPTFSPNDSEIAKYRQMFADLEARRAAIGAARALVIDLRHNGGGSSSWSAQAARRLWGAAAVDAAEDSGGSDEVWWRASPGNTAYVATWEELFTKQGQPASDIEWARKTAAGMKAALAAGRKFYIQKSDPEEEKREATPAAQATPFTTPVYVVTHGQCGSACLDALDLFKAFPNVKLIGSPTASDTNYMDVRAEITPSGLGQVVIPQKVYSGRKRGSGVFYSPDILVTSIDWSPETFLDRVEADLAARKGRSARR